MKWQSSRRSGNIEDRRGQSIPGGGATVTGGVGALILALLVALLGGDPAVVLQPGVGVDSFDSAPPGLSVESDVNADFVSAVLGESPQCPDLASDFRRRGY